MKTLTSVVAIGTALVITAATLTACGGKPTDIKTPQAATTITTVTTECPTTTQTKQTLTTTTAKPTTTTKRQTTTTTRTTTTVATTKPTVTTVPTTVAAQAPTTTKATAATTAATTVTTQKQTTTTAKPTATTTKKQTVATAKPTTTTTKKQTTTTAKPTATTTKKTTATAKPTTTTTTTTTTTVATTTTTKQPSSSVPTPSAEALRVFELINLERAEEGLEPLAYCYEAQAAADLRAQEISEYFSHTRPDGTMCFTVAEELGLDVYLAGENIALGHSTPEWVMTDWMESPGHCANILSDWYTGVVVGYNPQANAWVQLFVLE